MSFPRSKLSLSVCALTVLYWLAIFVCTHIPMYGPPGAPLSAVSLDKLKHLTAFAGLALLLCMAGATFRQPTWRMYLLVLVMIATYGIVDELTQMLVPTRSADLRDWFADLLGAGIGIAVFAGLWQIARVINTERAAG